MMEFLENVMRGVPSGDDLLTFVGCLLVLAALGTIQYLVSAVLGFKPRAHLIYGMEIVLVTLLVVWKIDYVVFQIGLPVTLFLATYYLYRQWKRIEDDDVPDLNLDKPLPIPPPEDWPENGTPVFEWSTAQALRHAERRFSEGGQPPIPHLASFTDGELRNRRIGRYFQADIPRCGQHCDERA